jgi:hypothetical protein
MRRITGLAAVMVLIIMAAMMVLPISIAAVFAGEAVPVNGSEGGSLWVAMLMGILAAVSFVLAGYFSGKIEHDEDFDPAKLIATVLMAILIGVVLTVTNVAVTEENVFEALFAYGGLTWFLYKIVKTALVYFGYITPSPQGESPPPT